MSFCCCWLCVYVDAALEGGVPLTEIYEHGCKMPS